MNVNQIEQSIEHREDFIKFGRDFEPIRYSLFLLSHSTWNFEVLE